MSFALENVLVSSKAQARLSTSANVHQVPWPADDSGGEGEAGNQRGWPLLCITVTTSAKASIALAKALPGVMNILGKMAHRLLLEKFHQSQIAWYRCEGEGFTTLLIIMPNAEESA